MATISKLIIEMMTDPKGVKLGLDKAEGYLREFQKTADQALATAGRGASGQALADNIIGSLEDRLTANTDRIREQLFRGILDPKRAEAQAKSAGQAMNKAILEALSELRLRGQATPEIEHQLIAQLGKAGTMGGAALAAGFEVAGAEVATVAAGHGARAGRSFAQTLTATIHRHRALIPTLAGLLLSQAMSSAGDIANVNAGLERTVETGKAAEKILEQVAMLASFVLDPIPGLIVAVIGGAAAAIVKIWTHAKEETLKARQEFIKELNGMIDAVDQIGLQKKLQDVLEGKRSSGRSVVAPGKFAGGLDSILEDTRRVQAAIDNMDRENRVKYGGLLSLDPTFKKARDELQKIVDSRQPLIAQLKYQAQELTNAILNPADVKAGNGGQLPGMQTNANSDRSGVKDLIHDTEKFVSVLRDQQRAGRMSIELMDQLGNLYIRLGNEENSLENLAHPFNDQQVAIMGARAQVEELWASLQRLHDVPTLKPLIPTNFVPSSSQAVPFSALSGPRDAFTGPRYSTFISGIYGRGNPDPFTGARRFSTPGFSIPTPTAAQLPANGSSTAELRLRATIQTVNDDLRSLGSGLRDLAQSSAFSVLRQIGTQLNPLATMITAIAQAARPIAPVLTKVANIVGATLGPVFKAFAPVLEALLPLLDALFRVLAPILRALAPLFQALIPILNALFPIIKGAAIAFTYVVQAASYLAGIFFNIAGGFTTLVGGVIAAIGAVISKIPFLGGFGRSIRDAGNDIKALGKGMEATANGLFETSRQMGKARDEIEGINIDPTQTAIDGLGDAANAAAGALQNVPAGYKVALARFNATVPGPPDVPPPPTTPAPPEGYIPPDSGSGPSDGGPSGSDNGGGGDPNDDQHGDEGGGGNRRGESVFQIGAGAIVIDAGNRSASDLADEIVTELQRRARAQFGNPNRWGEVTVG